MLRKPVVCNIREFSLVEGWQSVDQKVNQLTNIVSLRSIEDIVLQDPHPCFHVVVGVIRSGNRVLAHSSFRLCRLSENWMNCLILLQVHMALVIDSIRHHNGLG